MQFNEITGEEFDSLAQIALVRGEYDSADDYLRQAGEAYGSYGTQTGLLVRVVDPRPPSQACGP